MIIKSFIFAGTLCAIAQVIKDKTTLTSGHITTIYVVIGVILGFFGIYDKIIDCVGAGANTIIMSFGNNLYNSAIDDGIFNMLTGGSLGITASIIIAAIITIISRTKS